MKKFFAVALSLLGYLVFAMPICSGWILDNPTFGAWDKLFQAIVAYVGVLMVVVAIWFGTNDEN